MSLLICPSALLGWPKSLWSFFQARPPQFYASENLQIRRAGWINMEGQVSNWLWRSLQHDFVIIRFVRFEMKKLFSQNLHPTSLITFNILLIECQWHYAIELHWIVFELRIAWPCPVVKWVYPLTCPCPFSFQLVFLSGLSKNMLHNDTISSVSD